MNHKPKAIKFYHPGIISLIALPVLLVIYIYHDAIVTKYFSTEVVWRTRSIEATSNIFGSEFYRNYNDTSYRRYKTVLFDEQGVKAKAAIHKATLLIRQMIAKKDTVGGVRIKFGSRAIYKDMVDVIDLCNINEQPNFNYYCIDDEVMVFYKMPKLVANSDENIMWICGLGDDPEPIIQKNAFYVGMNYINQNLIDFGFNKISILIAGAAWFILFCAMMLKPIVSLFN